MKKRFTAADVYEKKYMGRISRYEQEAKRPTKKNGRVKLLSRMFFLTI